MKSPHATQWATRCSGSHRRFICRKKSKKIRILPDFLLGVCMVQRYPIGVFLSWWFNHGVTYWVVVYGRTHRLRCGAAAAILAAAAAVGWNLCSTLSSKRSSLNDYAKLFAQHLDILFFPQFQGFQVFVPVVIKKGLPLQLTMIQFFLVYSFLWIPFM